MFRCFLQAFSDEIGIDFRLGDEYRFLIEEDAQVLGHFLDGASVCIDQGQNQGCFLSIGSVIVKVAALSY